MNIDQTLSRDVLKKAIWRAVRAACKVCKPSLHKGVTPQEKASAGANWESGTTPRVIRKARIGEDKGWKESPRYDIAATTNAVTQGVGIEQLTSIGRHKGQKTHPHTSAKMFSLPKVYEKGTNFAVSRYA